jgi:tripartite-type tricarboxylate transporter receptor subunit TctC
MANRTFMCRVITAIVAALLTGASASAQESFYKGKTIRFIVAYEPGGGFDVYTRAIARHFGKYVPGNPTTIVENMTGAVGLIAANYVYNQAKPDGLTIGHFVGTLVLQHVLGNEAAKFDGRKFGWLGVPIADHGVCALTKASGISSLEAWLSAKEPVKMGGHGPGGVTSDTARILREAIGLPVRIIDGYKCTGPIRLAAESGEVAGGCWAWESMKPTWAKGFETGEVKVLVQTALKVHPELKDVPVAVNFAKTPEARQLLEILDHAYGTSFRSYSTPPGTPSERLQILQKAFLATMREPEFLADAKKARLDIAPIDGPTVARTLAGFYSLEPSMIARLKKVLSPEVTSRETPL